MSYKVPFVDPKKHYAGLKSEIDEAIQDCLANGDLIMRGQLRSYEVALAKFAGTNSAIGVNSGYHALHLSCLAAGLGPGDAVITVAHTFVATISAIVHVGATPILIDVTEDYNMDMDALEAVITPQTRAVIPVHLNGRMCDMRRLDEIATKHDLLIIEDAAQSVGATFGEGVAGSFGTTGCFSHYPFKILGGFGDGGAITTNDEEIAVAASRLRFNGEDRETGEYHFHGYTALLDNVQAAVLEVKLRHLPAWIDRRRDLAARYRSQLEGIDELGLPHFDQSDRRDVFQNYVIRTERRDELARHLTDNGIETLIHWPKPVWEHKALDLSDPKLPETTAICREVISLPMSVELTEDQVDLVGSEIRSFFGA